MNYSRYHSSFSEKLRYVLVSVGICIVISWLFYEHWFFMIFTPVVSFLVCRKGEEQKKQERFLIFEKQFQDGIQAVASGLMAGYSMENAWKEAYKEMTLLHGEKSYICQELKEINRQAALNVPIEELIEDLGRRSGSEEVENFAEVFRFAKRGGGNFVKIIQKTGNHMQEKLEVRQEIQLMVAAKRLEQNIMNIVPFGILAYLKLTSADFLSIVYGNTFGICFMSICLGVYGFALFLSDRILEIKV